MKINKKIKVHLLAYVLQSLLLRRGGFVFTADQGYDIVPWRAASQRTLASNLTVALA